MHVVSRHQADTVSSEDTSPTGENRETSALELTRGEKSIGTMYSQATETFPIRR